MSNTFFLSNFPFDECQTDKTEWKHKNPLYIPMERIAERVTHVLNVSHKISRQRHQFSLFCVLMTPIEIKWVKVEIEAVAITLFNGISFNIPVLFTSKKKLFLLHICHSRFKYPWWHTHASPIVAKITTKETTVIGQAIW